MKAYSCTYNGLLSLDVAGGGCLPVDVVVVVLVVTAAAAAAS